MSSVLLLRATLPYAGKLVNPLRTSTAQPFKSTASRRAMRSPSACPRNPSVFLFLAKHLPSWLPSPEIWTVLHDKPFRPVGEKRFPSHVGGFQVSVQNGACRMRGEWRWKPAYQRLMAVSGGTRSGGTGVSVVPRFRWYRGSGGIGYPVVPGLPWYRGCRGTGVAVVPGNVARLGVNTLLGGQAAPAIARQTRKLQPLPLRSMMLPQST